MAEDLRFDMDIQNVFSFADGRTVFVGTVKYGPQYIGNQQCEVLIDGVSTGVVEIEGEMIPDNSQDSELRSLSTLDHVSISRSLLSTSKCRLKSLVSANVHDKDRISKTA